MEEAGNLLTIPEAARFVRKTKQTIQNWIAAGKLETRVIGTETYVLFYSLLDAAGIPYMLGDILREVQQIREQRNQEQQQIAALQEHLARLEREQARDKAELARLRALVDPDDFAHQVGLIRYLMRHGIKEGTAKRWKDLPVGQSPDAILSYAQQRVAANNNNRPKHVMEPLHQCIVEGCACHVHQPPIDVLPH